MRDKIEAILKDLVSGIDLNCRTLVDSGFIGSLVLINLISELDIEFDIEITFDELTPDNFNSVDAIEALVARLHKP